MAEVMLSSLLPVLFEKLSDAALKSISRHKGLDAEIKKWERSLKQIQRVLADASRKEITDEAVKGWLNDLQHLAYDIDDVLDGWLTDTMEPEFKQEPEDITSKVRKLIIPTCCTNFSRDTTVLAKLDDISTKLEDLVKEKADLGLRVEKETRPRNNNNNNYRINQTSVLDPSSIVGRQAEKDALVQQLLLPAGEPCDKSYSIVPIIGMGGVGKTTLARYLYNDVQVKDHFELKAWICISDEFDVIVRSKEIFVAFEGELKEKHENFDKLQEALRDQLTGKRFLLVLDDVWSEKPEDWKTLVSPFYTCSPGSKILITSRKDILLKELGYKSLCTQLNSLSDDDALSLFALHALGVRNFHSHLSLQPHGKGIVKKCENLPLALIALGTSLRAKKDEDSWKKVLESEIWRLPVEDKVIPALRLSYLDLSAPLKRLFAYCSLFPKDFLFDKEDLVLLWMAEGFLHLEIRRNSTEECVGHEFFDELLSRSFFQHAPNNESLFVMHDLMNDLATSVATEFYLRLDNESEKSIENMKLDKYRHMSFVREKYVAYKKLQVLENAKCLRTFLATSAGEVETFQKILADLLPGLSSSVGEASSWSVFFLSSKILTDLLPGLPLLRVLSLSGFRISEVPESIGTLRHLRYLNLSQTKITHLPEKLCNLYNLQSLILVGCDKLTKLPNNYFLKLKNLRHLDVRYTPLLFQEVSEIGELKSLEITLSKIDIKSESGTEIAKLKDFKNLRGKISIEGLKKVKNPDDAHAANFSQKKLSELELVWSDGRYGVKNADYAHEANDSRSGMLQKEVLNKLKPCQDELIQLKIRSYGGLEFPKWVGDPSFLRLKQVSISGCKRCTSIPPLGQLPTLKELLIEGLDGVEVVGQAFPSLENLTFRNMRGWKKWSGAVFPSLQKLSISDCPNLDEVTLEAMPSLNDLELCKCDSGALRRLVAVASAVTKLYINSISGLNDVVWGGVIEYLGAVEELRILSCKEIRYLVRSDADASKILVKLRKLQVFECNNMERCDCPDGIEELRVWGCSSMTVVSFPKGGKEKLRSLTIDNCRKLLEREWEWGGEKMNNNNRSSKPMLESVWISYWPNLKSLTEMNCLVNLTTLIIDSCENLESFPDTLTSLKKLEIKNCPKLDVSFLPDNFSSLTKLKIEKCPRLDGSFLPDNFSSLTELEIRNCPKLDGSFLDKLTSLKRLIIRECRGMDASLPGWVWPPNLCFLEIGELKKPFFEWGPQKFPTSLVELKLYSGDEDGVSSCSEFSNLLPSSLTSLLLFGFENLESFSVGLQHLQRLSFRECPNLKKVSSHPQHLTSLHHLSFSNCPKMMDLSEMLLPSLLGLNVWCCPELSKRYRSINGSYSPIISHIPYISIL